MDVDIVSDLLWDFYNKFHGETNYLLIILYVPVMALAVTANMLVITVVFKYQYMRSPAIGGPPSSRVTQHFRKLHEVVTKGQRGSRKKRKRERKRSREREVEEGDVTISEHADFDWPRGRPLGLPQNIACGIAGSNNY
ncbi:hypothetical protein X777_03970 [Ooceraea biroi]|uniref:Uncharacterized protein n=1 Tax=Ooceraea biroi TaxID=2015173 RepID=A0A026WIF5_OOCBI|nr:hypothetical protein X777_03970 [Ooceraea biroi]